MDTTISPTVTFAFAGARITIPEATISELWLERIHGPRPVHTFPRLGEVVNGGTFMGIVHNEDGVDYTLWDLGEAPETMKHEHALAWAKDRGGDLPPRREQALMFANRAAGQFKEAWYWSKEQYAGSESYAWVQAFGDGAQSSGRKGTVCRARAVRREAIQ